MLEDLGRSLSVTCSDRLRARMKPAALVNTSATEIQRSIFRELSAPSLFESAKTTVVGEGGALRHRLLFTAQRRKEAEAVS